MERKRRKEGKWNGKTLKGWTGCRENKRDELQKTELSVSGWAACLLKQRHTTRFLQRSRASQGASALEEARSGSGLVSESPVLIWLLFDSSV